MSILKTKIVTGFLLAMFLLGASGKALAQTETAGHCIQKIARVEYGTTFFSLRNSCPSTVIAYYVALRAPAREIASGNAHVPGGGGIETTEIKTDWGIEVYACIAPHVPRDSDGNTPHRPVDGYTCH